MVNPDELYEGILERLLGAVPSDVDKRQGSVIYNALAPVALELQQIYEELEDVIKNTFADTAELDCLILRAKERGVNWLEATNAIVTATLTFDTEELTEEPTVVGSLFALENSSLMYEAVEKVAYTGSSGTYRLKCTETGIVGNIASGNLLIEETEDDVLPDALLTAEITGIYTSARDDEDVESLRKRYFESIDSNSFGGNISDYKKKSLEVAAIGAIQVIPVWDGGGTVKLRFLNAAFDIPTQDEIDEVQRTFDPTPAQEGYGLAPIGHKVTVVAADSVGMDVVCDGTYEAGYDFETLKEAITGVIGDYLLSLRKEWQDQVVTVSPGVLAYMVKQNVPHINTFSCTVNDEASDFVLDEGEAPILGTVTEA